MQRESKPGILKLAHFGNNTEGESEVKRLENWGEKKVSKKG